MGSEKYRVFNAPAAVADLEALRAFDRAQIREAIERFLMIEPLRESKSRIKRMEQPFWCQYRLRVGECRVYYDVDEVLAEVRIIRILLKGRRSTPQEAP